MGDPDFLPQWDGAVPFAASWDRAREDRDEVLGHCGKVATTTEGGGLSLLLFIPQISQCPIPGALVIPATHAIPLTPCWTPCLAVDGFRNLGTLQSS